MASGSTEGLSMQGSSNEKPLFTDMNADEFETTEIESLCMQCGETVRQLPCCRECSNQVFWYVYRVTRD